ECMAGETSGPVGSRPAPTAAATRFGRSADAAFRTRPALRASTRNVAWNTSSASASVPRHHRLLLPDAGSGDSDFSRNATFACEAMLDEWGSVVRGQVPEGDPAPRHRPALPVPRPTIA